MEGTMGEIRMFAGTFAPMYWAYCDGTVLPIANYSALYAVIGTVFGGDGITNFALPDLKGRIPVGTGQGPGLANVVLGQKAGNNNFAITNNELPIHSHGATATFAPKVGLDTGSIVLTSDPTNNFPGQTPSASAIYTATATANVFMGSNPVTMQINPAGNSIPFSIMQPYLGMNYVICTEGIFPSRN